ncbi:expressed protein, partial [Phakopsora pachyrhizi]
MILNFKKPIICLALWTKCTEGSEETVDFLAKFSGQTNTHSSVSNVFETAVQPTTPEMNWLSLGASSSNEESASKRFKKATENIGISWRVKGIPNDFCTNGLLRQPNFQIAQPNVLASLTAATMVENLFTSQSSKPHNVRWKHIYNPELFPNQVHHYQASVNSFKFPNILESNMDIEHITEIEPQYGTEKYKEQFRISNPSDIVLGSKEKSNGQTVVKKDSKKTSYNKKRKYLSKDKHLSETGLIDEVHEKVLNTLTPQQMEKFEKKLMELLRPENSLIKSNFFEGCISSLHKLNKSDLKDSMLANLDCIKSQIDRHAGAEFYITDSEAKDFLTKPEGISFKIKYNSTIMPKKAQAILFDYLKDLKLTIESMDFRSIIKNIFSAGKVKLPPKFNPEEWKTFHVEKYLPPNRFRKKMYIGKIFLVYSIMINKIFCDGPKNDEFIKRQIAAIEFYNSACGGFIPDKWGNFFIKTDFLVDSLIKKVSLEKMVNRFNKKVVKKRNMNSNLERTLFAKTMILIEI